jgi:hypothetical protein
VWLDPTLNDQVALVWAASDRLPATTEPGVGLILTQFRGTVGDGWFTKVLGPDTTVELVRVGDQRGYWITGEPHELFYEGPNGIVDETRRLVGDVLLWADGPITTGRDVAGRDAAIAIADRCLRSSGTGSPSLVGECAGGLARWVETSNASIAHRSGSPSPASPSSLVASACSGKANPSRSLPGSPPGAGASPVIAIEHRASTPGSSSGRLAGTA